MPDLVGLHHYREPVSPRRLQHDVRMHYVVLNIIRAVPYVEPELRDESFANPRSAILKNDDCVMMPYSAGRNRRRAGSQTEGGASRRDQHAEYSRSSLHGFLHDLRQRKIIAPARCRRAHDSHTPAETNCSPAI